MESWSQKHLANQPGSVNQQPLYGYAPPQMPSGYADGRARVQQELPRLQVPPLALAPQSAPAWKSSPLMAPQTAPAPRMSVSNLLSSTMGSFRSRPAPVLAAPAPARRLPSFQDILARTNLLHLVGRASEPEPQAQPQRMELEAQPEAQAMAPVYAVQPPGPSYTAFAPARVEMGALSAETAATVRAEEAPSPMEVAASPASQTSESSKRRERWTDEEHARFMEGLNRYGRKWKKIQTFVQTKTAVQVRTHAYGYFAKLLRNMPEDDAIWELAEEMSSLPGAVLKGPGSGKRRNEPKTDEAGMEVLRRFVFSKKKADDKKAAAASAASAAADENVVMSEVATPAAPTQTASATSFAPVPPAGAWSAAQTWSSDDSAMLEIKRQRLK